MFFLFFVFLFVSLILIIGSVISSFPYIQEIPAPTPRPLTQPSSGKWLLEWWILFNRKRFSGKEHEPYYLRVVDLTMVSGMPVKCVFDEEIDDAWAPKSYQWWLQLQWVIFSRIYLFVYFIWILEFYMFFSFDMNFKEFCYYVLEREENFNNLPTEADFTKSQKSSACSLNTQALLKNLQDRLPKRWRERWRENKNLMVRIIWASPISTSQYHVTNSSTCFLSLYCSILWNVIFFFFFFLYFSFFLFFFFGN